MSRPNTEARLAVIAAALLFATGGVAIKSCAFEALQVAGLRSAVAAIALFLLVPKTRQGFTPATFLVGLAYAATMVLFVLANKLTYAANAIYLQSAGPIYILILAPWLLDERFRRKDLYFILILGLGMVFLFSGGANTTSSAPNEAIGNLAGAGSGLAYAFTVMGFRWLSKHGRPSEPAILAGNAIAAAVTLPFALPITASGLTPWLWILYIGVIQIALAYLLLTRGLRELRALEASLYMIFEPVFNPVIVWLVLGETPGSLALVGGAIILLGTLAMTVLGERPKVATEPESCAPANH